MHNAMSEDICWAILRLMRGDLNDDRETVDRELDLDDSQLWFQRHPERPEFMQIVINLSGEQWRQIKDLPYVEDRTDPTCR
jgi:hypothetical protein